MTEPTISKALIDYLDHIAPDRAPALEMTEKEVWFHAGKVDVVRKLKQLFKSQTPG